MRALCIIVLIAVLAGITSVLSFDKYIHPEVRFFKQVAEASDAWHANLRKENRPCYIITGGSEVRAGIDPAIMKEKCDLPVVNAGAHAGFGMACNASLALRYVRPGDTLVLSLVTFHDEYVLPKITGMKLILQRNSPEIAEAGLITPDFRNMKFFFLGDVAQYSFYLNSLRKAFRRGVEKWWYIPYGYEEHANNHPSGWMEIPISTMKDSPVPTYQPRTLRKLRDDDALSVLLEKLARWTQEKGAHLTLKIPPRYHAEGYRAQSAFYALQLTQKGYRLLKDERLGVVTNTDSFSDSLLHLSAAGTQEHCLLLADALAHNKFWTESELIEELRKRGWNPDGTPLNAAP